MLILLSSIVVSWQRIYISLTVTAACIKCSFHSRTLAALFFITELATFDSLSIIHELSITAPSLLSLPCRTQLTCQPSNDSLNSPELAWGPQYIAPGRTQQKTQSQKYFHCWALSLKRFNQVVTKKLLLLTRVTGQQRVYYITIFCLL
jgi:hypothetical protein